jgi:hypothetical protein
VAVLWLTIILLALLLVLVRWSFGIITVPGAIALLVWLLAYKPTGTEIIASYALAWLLLLSGVRVAFTHGTEAWDAYYLRDTAFLPRSLWFVLWLGGTLWALVIGGSLLVYTAGTS